MNRPALAALRQGWATRWGQHDGRALLSDLVALVDALLAPAAAVEGRVDRRPDGGTWITCSACGETLAPIAWPPHRYMHDQADMWHRMALDQHVAGLANWSA